MKTNTMNIKKYCCLLLFTLLMQPAFSQSSALNAKIIELMEVMGASAQFETVVDNLINLQRQSYDGMISSEFWDEFSKEMRKDGFADLYEMIIPIYEKHFNEEDIDGIIAFYKSDVGLKMVSKQPMIMQEAMTAGAEWGKLLGEQIVARLEGSSALKFATEIEDCEAFKTGTFKEVYPDGSVGEYSRKGNTQLEKFDGNKTNWTIEWLADCRYQLTNTDPTKKDEVPVVFNIYEVTEKGYKYIGNRPGEDFYQEGEVEKIK